MKDLALRALDAVARPRRDLRRRPRGGFARTRNLHQERQSRGTSRAPNRRASASACWRNGCWGFAATDDLTPDGIESAAALALEIARAGTAARKHEVALAPEEKYEAVWASPMRIDPFTVPVDRNLAVLLAVDKELRRNPGVSLAEASMQFDKRRQIFVSTLGSRDRSDPLPFGRRLCRR